MTQFDAELETRLTRYAAIDSQSDEDSPSAPSTHIQFGMLTLLRDELAAMGAQDVTLTDYGVVLGTIPRNCPRPDPWLFGPCRHCPRLCRHRRQTPRPSGL